FFLSFSCIVSPPDQGIKEAVVPPPPHATVVSNHQRSECHIQVPQAARPPDKHAFFGGKLTPVVVHDAATHIDDKAARGSPGNPEIVDDSCFKHPPAREYPRRSGTLQAEAASRRSVLERTRKLQQAPSVAS
uniref:Uncharacterized protein n=1 Tax=Aegilops tauschii subsp. strangulata TaxID=200361 RepID=A0A453S2T1_AEGTS